MQNAPETSYFVYLYVFTCDQCHLSTPEHSSCGGGSKGLREILTTTPNTVTSAVHDRMPVILDPNSYDLWLDPGFTDVAAASELLKPYDARLMRSYPVSTRINHSENDDAECAKPIKLEVPPQGQLFA